MTAQTKPAIRATYDDKAFRIRIVSDDQPIAEIPIAHVQFWAEKSGVRAGPLSEFAAGPLTAALQTVYDGVDVREIERDHPKSFKISSRDYKQGGEFVTVTARDHFANVSRAHAFQVHNEEAFAQAFELLKEEARQQIHSVPAYTGPAAEAYD